MQARTASSDSSEAAGSEETDAAQVLLALGRDQHKPDRLAAPAAHRPSGQPEKRAIAAQRLTPRMPQQAKLKGFDTALMPFEDRGLAASEAVLKSTLAAVNGSSLAAGNGSSLAAVNGSSLAARAKTWLSASAQVGETSKGRPLLGLLSACASRPSKRPRLG
jgi:hypothetical protein